MIREERNFVLATSLAREFDISNHRLHMIMHQNGVRRIKRENGRVLYYARQARKVMQGRQFRHDSVPDGFVLATSLAEQFGLSTNRVHQLWKRKGSSPRPARRYIVRGSRRRVVYERDAMVRLVEKYADSIRPEDKRRSAVTTEGCCMRCTILVGVGDDGYCDECRRVAGGGDGRVVVVATE